MLFSPPSWLTLKLLVTNALMRMQWWSLGRGQGSSVNTEQYSVAYFCPPPQMKCGQVMLVIANLLNQGISFSSRTVLSLICWTRQQMFAPGAWSGGLRAFRSKHRVCSPANTSLSQENVSEEQEHASACCRTAYVFWLLVDINGKCSS